MSYGNFYKELDFKYPEIAILMEHYTDNNGTIYGKFFIPVLTPFVDSSGPYYNKEVTPTKTNIKNSNKSNLDIKPCNTSNFVLISIPKYLIIDNDIKKDDKFIIVFVGGDINHPCIIGREYN